MAGLSARAEADAGGNAARAFDPGAFERAVHQYNKRVTLAAYRITRNIDDARDVAQHVLIEMYRKWPLVADARTVDRWLYIVTRNAALSVARRRERDAAASVSIGGEDPQRGLEETVMCNERDERVRATIARLPWADRTVIELRHLQSIPAAEIATQLGIPLKRVKKDVERARVRLRLELMRCGMDSDLP